MSDYKGIQGTAVQNFAGDPGDPIAGQVWYDSVSSSFKYQNVIPTGAWATGGNLNTARGALAGAGIQTAGLAIGGRNLPAFTGDTESYNGTTWTELNNLNTVRASMGSANSGTNTATLAFGGEAPGDVYQTTNESWNGTSWTELNDLNTARRAVAGAGVQTSALAFGGDIVPGATPGATESWNGTSWTTVTSLTTARSQTGGVGATNTAALAFGGLTDPGSTLRANTESWNGSSWTELNDLNTARRLLGGSGTNTVALAFGGFLPPVTAATETWNGTSWTEVNDLSTARSQLSGAGSNTTALAFGGYTGAGSTNSAATEEWNAPASITETITITY
jgi:hypothetical protein